MKPFCSFKVHVNNRAKHMKFSHCRESSAPFPRWLSVAVHRDFHGTMRVCGGGSVANKHSVVPSSYTALSCALGTSELGFQKGFHFSLNATHQNLLPLFQNQLFIVVPLVDLQWMENCAGVIKLVCFYGRLALLNGYIYLKSIMNIYWFIYVKADNITIKWMK